MSPINQTHIKKLNDKKYDDSNYCNFLFIPKAEIL